MYQYSETYPECVERVEDGGGQESRADDGKPTGVDGFGELVWLLIGLLKWTIRKERLAWIQLVIVKIFYDDLLIDVIWLP